MTIYKNKTYEREYKFIFITITSISNRYIWNILLPFPIYMLRIDICNESILWQQIVPNKIGKILI